MARQGAAGNGNRGGQKPQRGAGRSAAQEKIFRRRRAAFGCLVVMVLVVLVVLAGGVVFIAAKLPASSAAKPAGTHTAPPSSSPSSSVQTQTATDAPTQTAAPSATQAATPTCDPSLVTVAASVDAQVYAPGQNPMLEMKVTNGGTVACEVNLGTSQMEYIITSGSDRIFSSKDCQDGSDDLNKTIAPGASETANFPWQRNRSAPGCSPVPVIPKPGYYKFQAILGQWTSNTAVFELQ
ncbi:MAG TPA: hypothetical protein VLI70_07290 [Micrococcaceae bacterium]|nr:hypothetical protein [Micrococcaceae bacterium]